MEISHQFSFRTSYILSQTVCSYCKIEKLFHSFLTQFFLTSNSTSVSLSSSAFLFTNCIFWKNKKTFKKYFLNTTTNFLGVDANIEFSRSFPGPWKKFSKIQDFPGIPGVLPWTTGYWVLNPGTSNRTYFFRLSPSHYRKKYLPGTILPSTSSFKFTF